VLPAGWVGWGVCANRTAESIPYEQRRTVDGLELRRYPKLTVVETTAPDQRTAFRRLFESISGTNRDDESISGTNRDDESISMTAPVETQGESIPMTTPVRSESAEQTETGMRMAFYLLQYSDPRTPPFVRRNEVAVAVADTG
jgi:hypothetical protein